MAIVSTKKGRIKQIRLLSQLSRLLLFLPPIPLFFLISISIFLYTKCTGALSPFIWFIQFLYRLAKKFLEKLFLLISQGNITRAPRPCRGIFPVICVLAARVPRSNILLKTFFIPDNLYMNKYNAKKWKNLILFYGSTSILLHVNFSFFPFRQCLFFIYSDLAVKLTLTHREIRASTVASGNKMRYFYAISSSLKVA